MANLWTVLAGAAIFVLGMNFLEEATQMLSGRSFKLFLKKNTTHAAKAIGIGTLASGILQSSSVVNLLVLSLAGSGAIPLRNALAVLLGSNLGTTLNTWILSSLGFRFDVDLIALPIIALAGIFRALLKSKVVIYNVFSCLLGLGFIMMGLELIKTGMGGYLGSIDLSMLNQYSVVVGLLFGILITALIQSSAATLVIVLSALHADVISLYLAMAVVLGAEIGTTLKFLFVSYNRESTMKRLALGNFLFNLLNAIAILVFLIPINKLITDVLFIRDPLYALAFFQTFVNLSAIILFSPFLTFWEKFLRKRFLNETRVTKYISKIPVPDIDLAINTLESEILYFLKTVLQFAVHITGSEKVLPVTAEVPLSFREQNLTGQYSLIKQLHGDIHRYYILLQNTPIPTEQREDLDRLMSSVRSGMFAAKSLQDAKQDILQLSKSANETKYGFYLQLRQFAGDLLQQISDIILTVEKSDNNKHLAEVYQTIPVNNTKVLNELYHTNASAGLSEIEISTIINFNRELSNALHSLILSVKDVLLNQEELDAFDACLEKEASLK